LEEAHTIASTILSSDISVMDNESLKLDLSKV